MDAGISAQANSCINFFVYSSRHADFKHYIRLAVRVEQTVQNTGVSTVGGTNNVRLR